MALESWLKQWKRELVTGHRGEIPALGVMVQAGVGREKIEEMEPWLRENAPQLLADAQAEAERRRAEIHSEAYPRPPDATGDALAKVGSAFRELTTRRESLDEYLAVKGNYGLNASPLDGRVEEVLRDDVKGAFGRLVNALGEYSILRKVGSGPGGGDDASGEG